MLEFSDSEDSDNEPPQETTSFTSTKEKISLGSKDDEETNKLKKRESDSEANDTEDRKRKRAFNPLSDSEDDDHEEGFLASKNKQTNREFDSKVDDQEVSINKQEKKRAFMSLSDSEEEEDLLPRKQKRAFMALSDSEEEEDFLPRRQKRAFVPLSDSEYEDDGDSNDEEDDGIVLPEAERTEEQFVALFDEEEKYSENEVSTHNRHRKTVNNDRDLQETYKQQMMDDTLFSDADDIIEEVVKKKKRVSRKKAPSSGEEEVYHKGDLDKKRQKMTAVPEIKLDENGDPIRKKRGKYRFTPRPVNKFNPYILFNKEVRSKIKQANPDLDNVAINLLVGKAYRELDPVSKKKN